jgi:N-acetyl-gamma-glutamyl-phosphate reductase
MTASCTHDDTKSLDVAVVGGSGYTGGLLGELLLRHPHARLAAISSEQLAGTPVAAHNPRLRSDLAFCRADDIDGVQVAFVCTPHGEAAPVVKRLLDDGARVVDLSADFRLPPAVYEEWYGPHPCPELAPAAYGLTELHRDAVAGASLVANPGCYPTAALLALAPLQAFGLVDVVIDAKSGVSGAGKAPSDRTHFCSVDSDLVAYGIGRHRHYPEIVAGLSAGFSAPTVTFVPHLVPLQRGIVETIYARCDTLPDDVDLAGLYRSFYEGERFVEMSGAPPQLKDVAGTNYCRLHPTLDERAGRVVVVAAIDNLMKGASGQAVQNMNLMAGLPEHEGLV